MIERIAQVKIPVTDLAVSVPWYVAVLDLRLWTEFVEDGELRGAGLIDRDARFGVALRDRRFCASKPDLSGFDVVAFTPSSRESLDELAARCDALGFARSEIVDFGDGWVLDVPDPDGTVLRFYHFTGRTDVFTGYSSASGGRSSATPSRCSRSPFQRGKISSMDRPQPEDADGFRAAWGRRTAALGRDHRPRQATARGTAERERRR